MKTEPPAREECYRLTRARELRRKAEQWDRLGRFAGRPARSLLVVAATALGPVLGLLTIHRPLPPAVSGLAALLAALLVVAWLSALWLISAADALPANARERRDEAARLEAAPQLPPPEEYYRFTQARELRETVECLEWWDRRLPKSSVLGLVLFCPTLLYSIGAFDPFWFLAASVLLFGIHRRGMLPRVVARHRGEADRLEAEHQARYRALRADGS